MKTERVLIQLLIALAVVSIAFTVLATEDVLPTIEQKNNIPPRKGCMFLESDIFNKHVHDRTGKKPIRENKRLPCGECEKHLYRDEFGCSPYYPDPFMTIKHRKTGETVRLCTSLSFPRQCPEPPKNPPQTE